MRIYTRTDPIERFWLKVNRNGPIHPILGTRCWLWTAGRPAPGYGRFSISHEIGIGAHVFAWTHIAGREIPEGHGVLHKCDVRHCVNYEEHLFTGTPSDNMQDCAKKGRLSLQAPGLIRRPRGESHGNSKLTVEDVVEIRRLASHGEKQRDIAARFGITQPSVGYIVRREQWSHV